MATSPSAGECPLSQQQLIDEYFIEHRTKVLDIAAFLDRFDRATARDAEDDFRIKAFRNALAALLDTEGPTRMHAVQMLLSDPRSDLLPELDRKSAFGAYEKR
ncbi:MAG TPA: hypothetical protein VGL99_05190 [Chloroflexota bacterium]|jgi:hypothetical protein